VSARRITRSRAERGERGLGWTVWVDRAAPPAQATGRHQLGQPGPWRYVRHNGGLQRVLECPAIDKLAQLAEVAAQGRNASQLLSEVDAWADATAHGELPQGWTAPEPEEVSTWVATERLSVRAGAHVARGELECDSGRLRLVFRNIVELGEALPAPRRAWARALCADTQSRWCMVRFALAGTRVRAEVDLSGVPPAIARPLLQRASESLVFSVGWALPALALTADPGVASRALDRGPWWERETPLRHEPESIAPQTAPAVIGA